MLKSFAGDSNHGLRKNIVYMHLYCVSAIDYRVISLSNYHISYIHHLSQKWSTTIANALDPFLSCTKLTDIGLYKIVNVNLDVFNSRGLFY